MTSAVTYRDQLRLVVKTMATATPSDYKAFTPFAALLDNKPREVKTIPFAENLMT
ncbi:hypothetical protein PMX13_01935 [Collinsella aerofaciens]|uniref:hypothetical protein n=1 Tax=Collinsella aerofaciens TaxID=74426 RepID=UPI0018A0F672|nr:hypothetical protein [Collinsella aerofaciens]MDB1859247.1 hypothetical protein [Collinsella aerofaciens]